MKRKTIQTRSKPTAEKQPRCLDWTCTNILFPTLSVMYVPQPCMGNENKGHGEHEMMHSAVLHFVQGSANFSASSTYLCPCWCGKLPKEPVPDPSFGRLLPTLGHKVCLSLSAIVTGQISQLNCTFPLGACRNVRVTFMSYDNPYQLKTI